MKETAKIMVVDDEVSIRESLHDWLKDSGHEVFTAANGGEALEILRDKKPEIVITDLVMPGMDGLELTKKIKELFPDIAVIIITAYGKPAAILHGVSEDDLADYLIENDPSFKRKVEEAYAEYLEQGGMAADRLIEKLERRRGSKKV